MQSKSRWIARRALLRIVALTLGVALALVVVPVATSAAAISITKPKEPATTGPLPSFSGTTEDSLAPVSVVIHEGATAAGPEAETLSTLELPEEGSWTLTATAPLSEAEYTAVAEQLLDPLEGTAEVHFSVSTKPPTVSIKGPSSPTSDTTPSFSGTASETEPVMVKVFKGTKTTGSPVATVEAIVKGGKWGPVSSAPALGEGEYTALAIERSSLGNLEGKSSTVSFMVETKSPTVTLETPTTPSKLRSPTFSGTASAETPVVVEIFEGTEAKGSPVSKATAAGTGGAFTTGAASPELATGNHTYTAVATQESPAHLKEGESEAVTFVVDTEVPKLNLQAIKARSNVNKPTFRGEVLSEPGTVTVHVYSGKEAKGTEVAFYEVAAPAVGVEWKVVASPALPDGVYTAQATEPSTLGNGTGKSETRTFEVDTEPPEVTLKALTARSGVNEPTFSGTVSEPGPVTVHVYPGKEAKGTEAGTYEVTVLAAGKWEVMASPQLPDGTYTAVATEPSGLTNEPGTSESRTFEIDTHAPEVALAGVPTPTNETNPSFSGTASETKNVTVKVYKGPTATGSPVATVEGAVSGGHWKSPSLATTLTTNTYTAVAFEPSSIGNGEGHSEPVTFEVNTNSPVVTLATPTTPSNNRTPAFTGTASANTEVVVHIYEGTEAEGTQVASATATGTEGAWSSAAAEPDSADRQTHICRDRDPGKPARQRRRQIQRGHVRRQHEPADRDPESDHDALQRHDACARRHGHRHQERRGQDLQRRRGLRLSRGNRRIRGDLEQMGSRELHHGPRERDLHRPGRTGKRDRQRAREERNADVRGQHEPTRSHAELHRNAVEKPETVVQWHGQRIRTGERRNLRRRNNGRHAGADGARERHVRQLGPGQPRERAQTWHVYGRGDRAELARQRKGP